LEVEEFSWEWRMESLGMRDMPFIRNVGNKILGKGFLMDKDE
jgi:hypothetical protein